MKCHAHFFNEPTVIAWKQEKSIYSVLKTEEVVELKITLRMYKGFITRR